MADPAGDGAATAPEPTAPTTQAPEGAPPDDGLTDTERAAIGQSEKPEVVSAILTSASKRAREAEQRASKAESELRKRQDAERTELERATARAEEAEQRATLAERSVLVARVAAANGVPADQTHRLVGETEEELTADAKSLAKLIRREPEQTDLGSGARPDGAAPGSKGFSEVIRQRARR